MYICTVYIYLKNKKAIFFSLCLRTVLIMKLQICINLCHLTNNIPRLAFHVFHKIEKWKCVENSLMPSVSYLKKVISY